MAVILRNVISKGNKNKEGSLVLHLTVVTVSQEHLLICIGYHPIFQICIKPSLSRNSENGDGGVAHRFFFLNKIYVHPPPWCFEVVKILYKYAWISLKSILKHLFVVQKLSLFCLELRDIVQRPFSHLRSQLKVQTVS